MASPYAVTVTQTENNIAAEILTGHAISDRIIYASKWGCALDCNIETGKKIDDPEVDATDDTLHLQDALDDLYASGGGELIIDGVALVSNLLVATTVSDPPLITEQTSALMIKGDNVTIRCLGGCGLFLKSNSHCILLGNFITGDTTAEPQKNISIIGGTYNCNGGTGVDPYQYQARYERNTALNYWVAGVWFGNIQHLVMEDVTIRNSRCFCLLLSLAYDVFVNRLSLRWDAVATGQNRDGIHLWGPVDNLIVKDYHVFQGDDDAIAINTNEGYAIYATGQTGYGHGAGTWGRGRAPRTNTCGNITNCTFENIYLEDCLNGVRFIGYAANYEATVCNNILIKNLYGSCSHVALQCDDKCYLGTIVFDGWWLTGKCSFRMLTAGPAYLNASITLRNFNINTAEAINDIIAISAGTVVVENGIVISTSNIRAQLNLHEWQGYGTQPNVSTCTARVSNVVSTTDNDAFFYIPVAIGSVTLSGISCNNALLHPSCVAPAKWMGDAYLQSKAKAVTGAYAWRDPSLTILVQKLDELGIIENQLT